MKLLLLVVLLLAAIAPTASAEQIYLASQGVTGPCGLTAAPFVPFSVNVVDQYSLGSTGSKWKIDNTASSADILPLGNSFAPYTAAGDPYSGIVVEYGNCLAGSFVIGHLDFVKLTGNTVPGCYQLRVVEFPGETSPLAVDCTFAVQSATGGFFTFDPVGKPDCYDCTTKTQPSTWGSVKALYR